MPNGTLFQIADELEPLRALQLARHGPGEYYLSIRQNADVYVRLGAWRALVEGGHLIARDDLWPELLEMCRFAGLRFRAFQFFEHDVLEHEMAERAAAMEAPSLANAMTRLASADQNLPAAIDAAGECYLASGNMAFFDRAMSLADAAGGWRLSLPWALRLLLVNPNNWTFHQRVFENLQAVSRPDLLKEYAKVLREWSPHPPMAHLFEAAGALKLGDPETCLKQLEAFERALRENKPVLALYRSSAMRLQAEAQEQLGRYGEAYQSFVAMNASQVNPGGADAERFYVSTLAKRDLRIPPLPPDGRTDVVQMLGFPRSGTTLLENVLSAHPLIETFEEVPALRVATEWLEEMITGARPLPNSERVDRELAPFLAAREKYYDEIERLRQKRAARMLVDKMPLRSSEAAYIGRLFPQWRYVFSIRHPFDVVLSGFKQTFTLNNAMENFRTIENALRMYDFTMTQWFDVHSLDDRAVHYVRYDELVTDFEPTTRAALEFLGVEWDDAVRQFAEAAGQRRARTPSYAKVRQGLSIGVQSSWRKYGFLFQSGAAEPVRKWVRFLGYDAD